MLLYDKLYNECFDIIAGPKKLFSYQLFEVILDTFVSATCSDAPCRRSGGRCGKLQANFAIVHIQMHEFFQKIRTHNVRGEIEIGKTVLGANAIEDHFGRFTFGRIVQLQQNQLTAENGIAAFLCFNLWLRKERRKSYFLQKSNIERVSNL